MSLTLPTREVANIATRLSATAREMPDAVAVITSAGRDRKGNTRYRRFSFRELDEDSDRIAYGLRQMGVRRGARLALLVRPSFDFISLVFGLFKSGAVQVLIDPGMGHRHLLRCLAEAQPTGFVAIAPVQAVRTVLRHRFPEARWNVTVGRRWFWGGPTLAQWRRAPWPGTQAAQVTGDDPAAIIFTTGSTGPPKGVLYRHGNFWNQVDEIRDRYGIAVGEIDVACFPLFALFNCAMGVTTVIPEMDASRPARADPRRIVSAIRDTHATQAFGSPAVWDVVGRYCQDQGVRLTGLRRVLSAGAPVPLAVLERMQAAIHPEGDVFTPYGATEALPVASISAREIFAETAQRTRTGHGVCVGTAFPGIEWRVIRVVDGPIASIDDAQCMPRGEIGELIVRGPVVTREYVTRVDANRLAKLADGEAVWHRMGDVGYLDEQGRFWFCGRMAHRVRTPQGTRYTIPCEAIFNALPAVRRSALVGVGRPGEQRPVIIVEPWPQHWPRTPDQRRTFLNQLREAASSQPLTADIQDFLFHRSFPVDVRHNAKIFREKLALWAVEVLRQGTAGDV